MDLAAHRAFQGDRELHLTAKEFDLLRVLVRDAGAVVSRETLMREVWDSDPTGSTKTLDMHVSWLRRKLGDDANDPRYIAVSYTHLRAHETRHDLVCRLMLEKKKKI